MMAVATTTRGFRAFLPCVAAEQLLAEVGEHRFLAGLAALGLLSEVAGEQPLVCVVDDGQWLGQASGQTLGFTGAAADCHPVGPVFAACEPGAELPGLPELAVAELGERHARTLARLGAHLPLDRGAEPARCRPLDHRPSETNDTGRTGRADGPGSGLIRARRACR
jgi:hypothetical protein